MVRTDSFVTSVALLEASSLVCHYRLSAGLLASLVPHAIKTVRAVDGVSLTVAKGEMLALVGESGCGKTTTAQAVLRLIDLTSGSVKFKESDISKLTQRRLRPLRQRMQMVYQDPYESLNPRHRVRQIVEEPLRIHRLGGSSEARRRLVTDALSRVELNPPHTFLDRYPHELSGGQRQRVAIAASLVVQPEFLVADEPVSMLDVSVRAGIMALLRRLSREDAMGILMITHDLAVAAHFADRIAVMYLGRIVETGDAREVLRNPKHPYTQALCEVAPRREPMARRTRLNALRGEPGNAASIPPGCRFHPRCPNAEEQCKLEDPVLHRVVGAPASHQAACLLVP
jgi:oligopeptide/dipeptide ABC transporter ATP-binding protein